MEKIGTVLLDYHNSQPANLQFGTGRSADFHAYRKIPNVSPGLIEVLSTFWGAYIRGGGLYSGTFKSIVIYRYYRQKMCFI